MIEQPKGRTDLFQVMSIACIVLGMVLVISAAIFWFLTGRESATIMGAGVTLAIGGGVRNMLKGVLDKLPAYVPPPPDLPDPTPTPVRHGKK